MHRFSRTILGYHGCRNSFASDLLSGTKTVAEWRLSNNSWDWLGRGIYFWEHAPDRALRWAIANVKDDAPAVIGAVLDLGRCFDLTEIRFAEMLGDTYNDLTEVLKAYGQPLPENRGGDDRKNRQLDCLVINACLDLAEQVEDPFQSVRSPFVEGGAAFPGAMVMKETHIQIAVRDRTCILGVFRPTLKV